MNTNDNSDNSRERAEQGATPPRPRREHPYFSFVPSEVHQSPWLCPFFLNIAVNTH